MIIGNESRDSPSKKEIRNMFIVQGSLFRPWTPRSRVAPADGSILKGALVTASIISSKIINVCHAKQSLGSESPELVDNNRLLNEIVLFFR